MGACIRIEGRLTGETFRNILEVEEIYWLARSPDLNSLANVWTSMLQKIKSEIWPTKQRQIMGSYSASLTRN